MPPRTQESPADLRRPLPEVEDPIGEVLVVDDDLSLRQFLTIMLKRSGYVVRAVGSGKEALRALAVNPADVVVTDLSMEQMDGMAVLRKVKEGWPDTEVVMITAYATTENAVEAMKQGAYDYVVKPFNVDELKLILEKAFEKKAICDENESLRKLLTDRYGYGSLVGSAEEMQQVYGLMDRVKDTPITVLISGESGTGKELVARAIHYEGLRKDKPFQSINCSAIPENLIEAELFGHRKGAFTGAVRNHKGLFSAADGGTLFLDEVGEMPLATQVKVLRAIQERRVKPVGGVDERPVDVRILAATNRNLLAEVREGRFREDLYYRLKVVSIELPPLRKRRSDLPMLCRHVLDQYGKQFGKGVLELSEEAAKALSRYSWPGNVRELENAIQRGAALAAENEIGLESLPPEILDETGLSQSGDHPQVDVGPDGVELESLLEEYETQLLRSALETAGGVKKDAAKLLGISFRSFRYRLQKIGLEEPPRE